MNSRYYTLDPLYSEPVKLFIVTVLSVLNFDNRPGHYLLCGSHVIRDAEICGIIAAVEQTYNLVIYTIDDGTGTMRCCKWKDEVNGAALALGTLVIVRGSIDEFRGSRQLTILNIDIIEEDPNREMLHDMQTLHLYKTIYSRPFVLPDDIAENEEAIEKELESNRNEFLRMGIAAADSQPQDAAVDHEYFHRHYLMYLKQAFPDREFEYTAGISHPPLMELAKRVIMAQVPDHDPTMVDINKLFAAAVQAYLKRGDVVALAEDKDLNVLVDERALRQVIYRIIRTKQDTLDIAFGGIMLDYIIARVHEERRYGPLPRDKIVRTLDDMVLDSVLYMTKGREYKVAANHASAP